MNDTRKHAIVWSAAIASAMLVSASSFAQWSHNPAVNTVVSNASSAQVQPKLVPTADGGHFVVWLDNSGPGYDTRLQRVNSQGVKQWRSNGVLVADTAFSSTQDYGFAVDAAGNAVIAYRDDGAVAGGPVQIKVQKVDAAGSLLWGAGIQVSAAAGGSAPQCCVTSDGGVVVAWTNSSGVAMVQKLDGAGAALWTVGGVPETAAAGFYFLSGLVSDSAGGALALYVQQSGAGPTLQRHLKMQRYAAVDGSKIWNAGSVLPIFDGGFIATAVFPQMVSDGSGGAVIAWYDAANASTRNCFVQHVSSAGVEQFAHNGLAFADTVAGRMRVTASVGYDASTGDIYVVCEEGNISPQGSYFLRGQRITSAGAYGWGSAGVILYATGADRAVSTQVQPLPGTGVVFAWYIGPINNAKVRASRLDLAGAFAWPGNIRDVCTAASNKLRLWSSFDNAATRLVLAWSDSRTDANDILAQRVNFDGSLGTPGDVDDNGSVDTDDLLSMLGTWGACPGAPSFCAADLYAPPAGDGAVNTDDLLLLLANWGG